MVSAIVILSIAVIVLIFLLIVITAAVLDLRARAEQLNDMLREKEDNFFRASNLVYEKFGYRVPMSEKYLAIAEILHEKETKQTEGN